MRIFACVALALGWSTLAANCFALSYTLTALGHVFRETDSNGYGLNSGGQVVGMDYYRPALFSDGTVQVLADLTGEALAINDGRQIVGSMYSEDGMVPFLYSDGVTQVLAFPGTKSFMGAATGINSRGDVVGWNLGVDSGSNSVSGVFLYSGRVMQNIDPNGGGFVGNSFDGLHSYSINDHGQIAGHFSNGGFLFSDGVAQPPPTLPGVNQYWGLAINDSGDVAGTLRFGSPGFYTDHAFVYSGGVMHDLGPGEAVGINSRGQVIGNRPSVNGKTEPFLFSDGLFYNINDLLIPPIPHQDALLGNKPINSVTAINDAGQVTGIGDYFYPEAVLLTPVPEPSSIALAAIGLVGLAAWGWRRTVRVSLATTD